MFKKITIEEKFEVLENPYSKEELYRMYKENPDTVLKAVVQVDSNFIIDNDFNTITDELSEKMIGSPLLMEVEFRFIAALDGSLYLEVTGYIDPTSLFEEFED